MLSETLLVSKGELPLAHLVPYTALQLRTGYCRSAVCQKELSVLEGERETPFTCAMMFVCYDASAGVKMFSDSINVSSQGRTTNVYCLVYAVSFLHFLGFSSSAIIRKVFFFASLSMSL